MRPKILPICRHIYSREARSSSPSWNVTKTRTQALSIWVVFLFAIPAAIYFIEGQTVLAAWRFGNPTLQLFAIALFALCGIFALTTGVIMAVVGDGTPLPFDTARKLVIRGPYRYVRNPMALASMTQGLAVGLYLGSPLVIFYATMGYLYWDLILRPWEESDLEQRFGSDYVTYKNAVPCWTPRLRPYTAEVPASALTTDAGNKQTE